MKSDPELQQDVLCELLSEPALRHAGIAVEVDEGVVTLTGELPSHRHKWDAASAVQRVTGARALAINLTVESVAAPRRADADIAQAAAKLLQWLAGLPRDAVQVRVRAGRVTLSGLLDWNYQRRAAAEAVQDLEGVQGVDNRISIRPRVPVTAVLQDIEAALERRARNAAHGVTVYVSGGEVTLGGQVATAGERELAADAAWALPGVRSVRDRITVRRTG